MAETPSYIDYEVLLSPDFSPYNFANRLVRSTNDPTDTSIDLSTPLSRTLFDVQEIDTHIHNLTTRNAVPIVEHVRSRDERSRRILTQAVEGEAVQGLKRSYAKLEKEVLVRYEEAERARLGSLRSLEVLKLARVVSKVVALARQLEVQAREAGMTPVASAPGTTSDGGGKSNSRAGIKADYEAMVRAVYTLLELRKILDWEKQGKKAQEVEIVQRLKQKMFTPIEDKIVVRCQQIIREFSISQLVISPQSAKTGNAGLAASVTAATPFSQLEDAKARTSSVLVMLYLLSPVPSSPTTAGETPTAPTSFKPTRLLSSLQAFFQSALTSSLASISRALTTLPTLERTLHEVSVRCQSVTALEMLLAAIPTPENPLLTSMSSPGGQKIGSNQIHAAEKQDTEDFSFSSSPVSSLSSSSSSSSDDDDGDGDDDGDDSKNTRVRKVTNRTSASRATTPTPTLLFPLLDSFDTTSLPSYFWRSLASLLSSRVQEILNRGGVSARTLRSNKDRVDAAIRECVLKGGELPEGLSLASISSLSSNSVKMESEMADAKDGGNGDLEVNDDNVKGNAGAKTSWDREAAVMSGSVLGVLNR